jgi:hypothetical protein
VLSTPPAFVLSQNQTLQTKTTQPSQPGEFESEQSDYQQKTPNKLASKKQPHPSKREKKKHGKTTNKNHQTHY